jgi:hypothetical protein
MSIVLKRSVITDHRAASPNTAKMMIESRTECSGVPVREKAQQAYDRHHAKTPA